MKVYLTSVDKAFDKYICLAWNTKHVNVFKGQPNWRVITKSKRRILLYFFTCTLLYNPLNMKQ